MNRNANALTRLFDDLPTYKDKRLLQPSRIVLKPENFWEVHTSNIPFDSAVAKPISEPALSYIDDNDFPQLESKVIQSI